MNEGTTGTTGTAGTAGTAGTTGTTGTAVDPFEALDGDATISSRGVLHARAADALEKLARLRRVLSEASETVNRGGHAAVGWHASILKGPGHSHSHSHSRSPDHGDGAACGDTDTALRAALLQSAVPAVRRWHAEEFGFAKHALREFLPPTEASEDAGIDMNVDEDEDEDKGADKGAGASADDEAGASAAKKQRQLVAAPLGSCGMGRGVGNIGASVDATGGDDAVTDAILDGTDTAKSIDQGSPDAPVRRGTDSGEEVFRELLETVYGGEDGLRRAVWCTERLGGPGLVTRRLEDCRTAHCAATAVMRGEAPWSVAVVRDAGLDARKGGACAAGDARAHTAPLSPVLALVRTCKWAGTSRVAVVSARADGPDPALLHAFGSRSSVLTVSVFRQGERRDREHDSKGDDDDDDAVGTGEGHGFHFDVPVPRDVDFGPAAAAAARHVVRPVLEEYAPDIIVLALEGGDASAPTAAALREAVLLNRPRAPSDEEDSHPAAAGTLPRPTPHIVLLHGSRCSRQGGAASGARLEAGVSESITAFCAPRHAVSAAPGAAPPAWLAGLRERLAASHDDWRCLCFELDG